MKKNFLLLLIFPIIFLVTTSSFVKSEIYFEGDFNDTLCKMQKLNWISPDFILPGTFNQYLENNPYRKSIFQNIKIFSSMGINTNKKISILVNNRLYNNIEIKLNVYISDLQKEGYDISLNLISGGNPNEIKNWIKNEYKNGTSGVLLIGDIPAAWAEVSGSIFPCDLFYMDLDGSWRDNNNDGIYEIHTSGSGDMGPEIYIARIYTGTLDYDSEENMVNQYFEKTHSYRIGELSQIWRGLEYIDDDWHKMDVYLNLIYDNNVDRYDYPYYTTGSDYLKKLDLGQNYVQVCAHSYSGGHHFSRKPTTSASYSHIYIYSPTERNAKIYFGCDDGIKTWLNGENIFTKDRYGKWIKDFYNTDVQLISGWNNLLCKISQKDQDYRFSVKFVDPNGNTFNDLKYQINNPQKYGFEADYIRGWLLNGFHQDNSDNFYKYLTRNYLIEDESNINPKIDDFMGGLKWSYYDSDNPFIDLNDYCFESDFGVCYAFNNINSFGEKNCQLWLGYDDGARVWLNGEEILYDNRYGEYEPDMKKINITLKDGNNRLLIKISEWMGDFGFTAKICNINGTQIDGISYNPEASPMSYIGTWLINGIYKNDDPYSRLNYDYLNGEEFVRPSEGDNTTVGLWIKGIGKGCPFDLLDFFNKGDWVLSKDIQKLDPPVLFYNLFSCGPGRFTDENYLAGSYIYNTSTGLITVASSKSGSMLNFEDFTEPLGRGMSFGESFYNWFNDQAPYELWEKEWYYGLILNGDPTLYLIEGEYNKTKSIKITYPNNGIYFKNKELIPFFLPIIFGDIEFKVDVTGFLNQTANVDFFINNNLIFRDEDYPYEYLWKEKSFGIYQLKVISYFEKDNFIEDNLSMFIINLNI